MNAEFLTETERQIGQQLAPLWRNARLLFGDVAALDRACSSHAGDRAFEVPAARAQHILLARVADDLSGLLVLAAVGYEMQALTLSSAAYEAGHLAAFIGSDDALASRWLDWKSHDKMPWSVAKITAGALRNAGRYTEPTSQRQYIFYQSACLAKHANPLLQRQAPVADSEFARTLNADPVVTASATNRAFIGAYMAGVSALIAAEVYLRGAGLASSELQDQARETHSTLEYSSKII